MSHSSAEPLRILNFIRMIDISDSPVLVIFLVPYELLA